MRCFSDVLKKTLPPDVFGDVLEKVKHRTNDASNDVSRPALKAGRNINKQVLIYLKTSQDRSPYDIPKMQKADKISLRSTIFQLEKKKQQMIDFELYNVCWQYF